MDAFSYLSVLLSIIIGLAITQILSGYRALLLARARVAYHAPPLIWSAVLLLIATQSWWASFGLEAHHQWTFLGFATLLMQTVLLYMAAGLVLPDVPADRPIDLVAHYRRETTPFFLVVIVMLLVSIGKERLLIGRLPSPMNLAFHGTFGAGCLLGLICRTSWVHLLLSALTGLLMIAYIALLFGTL